MEIWKDIPGYEGYYQISNLGRIRSLDRYANVCGNGKRLVKGRIIKSVKCTNGYYEASLNRNGVRKVMLLHRVVANVFIPNPFTCFTRYSIKGMPLNGYIGFGFSSVNGIRRVPNPPANITACSIINHLIPFSTQFHLYL